MTKNQFKSLTNGLFVSCFLLFTMAACKPQAHLSSQTIQENKQNVIYSTQPVEVTATRISAITGKQPDENELPLAIVVAKRTDTLAYTD